MAPKKRKGGLIRDLTVGEDFRIGVNLAIKKFRNTEEENELEFPSSLDSDERAYVHRLAAEMGLQSKSRGKGQSRFLTVYKTDSSTIMHSDARLNLTGQSHQLTLGLLTQCPLTPKERQDLVPPTDRERNQAVFFESRDLTRTVGKLGRGIPLVPSIPVSVRPEIISERQSLPIFAHRAEILHAINQNQVVLITGETGSGKTTQVPQYILEHATENQIPVRIVCSEPRRLAAVSVADRVVSERNDTIGQTIGYQIRLESRVSPRTQLIFCTNGVLLRSMMGGEGNVLGSLTHVIVDEIHERDRFSDFLVTVLRDALNKYRNLKLILMSATTDVQLFMQYFGNLHHVSVPGRTYPVEEFFLEKVLVRIGYSSEGMKAVRMFETKAGHKLDEIDKNVERIFFELENLSTDEQHENTKVFDADADDGDDVVVESEDVVVDIETMTKMDAAISKAFQSGNFDGLLEIVNSNPQLVDVRHSHTRVSPLMAAAGQGNMPVIEQLLALGADVSLKASNGWTAKDFAAHMCMIQAVEILDSYQHALEPIVHCGSGADNPDAGSSTTGMSEDERHLLAIYHNSFNDDEVDHDLIKNIISHIQSEFEGKEDGAILVFLPGYEDIVTMKDLLSNNSSLLVLMLHSQMMSLDQHQIFRSPPRGIRKVILSTNIAETSITVQDVVFVIDSGKLKEKSYDALSGVSMLKVTWVSQTSATQRKGRAGRCRPGQVYRLFSSKRFESFQKYQTPEILRTPLMELCLQTKLLSQPPTTPIADFLARTPQPPSFMVTRNAVQMLKTIEALDAWEDVTELGSHLLDLPIEPRLGKMLLYSIILKCLDPIMTIVSCVAYKDPFLLPADPSLKVAAAKSRKKFAADSKSDHMALLRVFQAWQKSRADGRERSFCRINQISSSTMDMITGMRAQILGQLRAAGFVRAKGPCDIRDLNRNSENWAVVKAALTAGAYPNLARFDQDGQQLRTQRESKVRIHRSSVLFEKSSSQQVRNLPTDWLVFDEMTRAGRLAMIRGVTAISPITVAIFAGPNRLPTEAVSEADASIQGNVYLEESSDSEAEAEEGGVGNFSMLRLDDWACFKSDSEVIHLVFQLRQKWSALFLRRLSMPGKQALQSDDFILQTIVNVLSAEEAAIGLIQPQGIGQRPKPLPVDSMGNSSSGSLGQMFEPQEMATAGSSELSSYLPAEFMPVSPAPSSSAASCFSPPILSSSNRFFIIKATNSKALEVSLTHGLWQFGNQTEKRLIKAIKSCSAVILIFSVQGSGHFQGLARFLGKASGEKLPELQSQGQGSGSGIQYYIEWLKRSNIPFQSTRHLLNPYNENKKVQTSRDGQEIHPNIGESLVHLWDKASLYVPRQNYGYQGSDRSGQVRPPPVVYSQTDRQSAFMPFKPNYR